MRNILRRIRRELFKNKFSKYIFYAVGEIILVIIGILIAIQINNWNEKRKLRKLEIVAIQNLIEEINFNNNSTLQPIIKVDSVGIERNKKLLKILKNRGSVYQDSMSTYFASMLDSRTFLTRKITYENLKSTNFNVIRSDSIRIKLSFMYDGLYAYLEDEQNEGKKDARQELTKLIHKEFEQVAPNKVVPNNFELLKSDNEFKNTFSFYIYKIKAVHDQNVSFYEVLEEYRKDISEYLTEIE